MHNLSRDNLSKKTIAVIGLGYVGLPLAVEFGKKYLTIGFDISEEKIRRCAAFNDPTGGLSTKELRKASKLTFSSDISSLRVADIFIVAVPTPIDEGCTPDLSPLIAASKTLGKIIRAGSLVIFESTVYPGATEGVCIPVIEKYSKLKWKIDFNIGYSPERINPGDKERTLTKITKVVSGDCEETLKIVSKLYDSIIDAGVYRAPSIQVAEAAKVIENSQRDLNIALMNELSIIFNKMGLRTSEVLAAAQTKWNFLPFKPGLVGGHCIGVDPYYLTYKAAQLGYHSQIILAGRRINDEMARYTARTIFKFILKNQKNNFPIKILILGATFKENCPDIRNSKIVDLFTELIDLGCNVSLHDPIACPNEMLREYNIKLGEWNSLPNTFDAVIIAVPHETYVNESFDKICALLKPNGVFADLKSAFNPNLIKSKGFLLWTL